MRSLLYIPAHNEKFIGKAHERGADAIILDLEDGVPPAHKDQARDGLRAAVRAEDLPAGLPSGEEDFPLLEPPLVVRRRDGRHTVAYAALRLSMGFPPGDLSPPAPD